MKEAQDADANIFRLVLRLRPAEGRQQARGDDPTLLHLRGSLLSTAAIMRPATPAAIDPGLPCNRTSNTMRGWSAGTITRAKPSPGAFLGCVHSAVPVLASARECGNSAPAALAVPFCADNAIPCKTGTSASSREWFANSR